MMHFKGMKWEYNWVVKIVYCMTLALWAEIGQYNALQLGRVVSLILSSTFLIILIGDTYSGYDTRSMV